MKVLTIDPIKTREALNEVAATFGTLANEKFMLEAEHIAALPEDKQAQAKLFADKQKERIQNHVLAAKTHLNHYVELILLAEAGKHMPQPRDYQESMQIIGIMKLMSQKVMAAADAHRERCRQANLNPDGTPIPYEDNDNNQTKH